MIWYIACFIAGGLVFGIAGLLLVAKVLHDGRWRV